MKAARILPTVAALTVVVVTVMLGRWQLDRAQLRVERAERYDSLARLPPLLIGSQEIDAGEVAAFDYRRVQARGEWLTEYGIFLDNQVYRGEAGYYVYMPMRLAGSEMNILVNRGWVAAGRDRTHLPEIKTQAGVAEIFGSIQAPVSFKELGTTYREGRVWENVTQERFKAWSGLKLQPLIIRQTDGQADGLVRTWLRPDSGADKNRAYAAQWFALAGLVFILWAYHFFKRKVPDVE